MSKQTKQAQKEVNDMMRQLHNITKSENKKQQKEASNLEERMRIFSNGANRFKTTRPLPSTTNSSTNQNSPSKSSPSPVSARKRGVGVKRIPAMKRTSFKTASPSSNSNNRKTVSELLRRIHSNELKLKLKSNSNSNFVNSNLNSNFVNSNNRTYAEAIINVPAKKNTRKKKIKIK